MIVKYFDNEYENLSSLNCEFFEALLETKDSKVELNMYYDVFCDIYFKTLKKKEYEREYLTRALAYFGYKFWNVFIDVKFGTLKYEKEYLQCAFYFGYSEELKLFEQHLRKQKVLAFFDRHLKNININSVRWDRISQNESIPVEFFKRHLDKVVW